jgi:hypothetical protein
MRHRSVGDHVPHGLEHAAGRQVPAGKVELRGTDQYVHQHVVAGERLPEGLQLLVHRPPTDLHAAYLTQATA